LVRRSELTVNNMTVAEWEIPMIEYAFGDDGQVEVTDEFVPVTKRKEDDPDYPSPRDEYERLKRVYGSDRKSGVPHVQTVFGPKGTGVRALAKLIQESKAAEEAEASARPRGRKWSGLETHPLLA
jgi:hypothetical protein